MKLSDTTIRRASPKSTTYNLTDGKGLHVEVNPSGSKLWRINYRFRNKQGTLYLPAYPIMSLQDARAELIEVKKDIQNGIDPKVGYKQRQEQNRSEEEQQKYDAAAAEAREKTTFRYVAQDWLNDYKKHVLPKQISKIERYLEKYLNPAIGGVTVMDLKPADILGPARKKEAEGKIHTAHRLVSLVGQVLDHAIYLELIEHNYARGSLIKKLAPEKVEHHAAITDPRRIGELLCDIEDYKGYGVMSYYLRLIPYVFTRNTELRMAEWVEFDLDGKIWTVPKDRMKIKVEDHKVPLAHQVISLLIELKEISGNGKFVFPSPRAKSTTLSDAGPLGALRSMGYDRRTMTIHGFRTIASTLLNEYGYPYDHIEKQLAHKEDDDVRGAYNRAEYIEKRRTMLQDWADIIDRLRQEARERRAARVADREKTLS